MVKIILLNVIVFLAIAVILVQAFPASDTVKDDVKTTVLKPHVEVPNSEPKKNEKDGALVRIGRAANPQVGHFVNYIKETDRFPTVA